MKQSVLFFVIMITGVTTFAQQDSIPNGGFESWGTNPFYDEADNWTTLNPLAAAIGGPLAYQVSDAAEVNSGSFAIKLETTILIGAGVTPSILTNGVVNTATQDVEGGAAINSRPLALEFAYRFDPIGSDSAIASIILTKWDANNGTSLIGSAEAVLGSTSGSWVSKQLEINYGSQEVPDTALILFATGDGVNSQQGTALFVDDVEYSYSIAGMAEAEEFGIGIYPNPATDVLRISTSGSFQLSAVNILSVEGRFVSTTTNRNTLDIGGLDRGVYILELQGKNGEVAQHRFVKN